MKKGIKMAALKHEFYPNYTYNEYVGWDGKWELIHGLVYAMSPAPMPKHQKISNKIAWQLENILQKCRVCQALLPVDWKISDSTVVQPDNLVVCNEPLDQSYITKAPKIIFEILSRSTMQKDLKLKYNLYEKEGVEYYVIVDPEEQSAKVYKLIDGKYTKHGDAHNETIPFPLNECQNTLEFNFGLIW